MELKLLRVSSSTAASVVDDSQKETSRRSRVWAAMIGGSSRRRADQSGGAGTTWVVRDGIVHDRIVHRGRDSSDIPTATTLRTKKISHSFSLRAPGGKNSYDLGYEFLPPGARRKKECGILVLSIVAVGISCTTSSCEEDGK